MGPFARLNFVFPGLFCEVSKDSGVFSTLCYYAKTCLSLVISAMVRIAFFLIVYISISLYHLPNILFHYRIIDNFYAIYVFDTKFLFTMKKYNEEYMTRIAVPYLR